MEGIFWIALIFNLCNTLCLTNKPTNPPKLSYWFFLFNKHNNNNNNKTSYTKQNQIKTQKISNGRSGVSLQHKDSNFPFLHSHARGTTIYLLLLCTFSKFSILRICIPSTGFISIPLFCSLTSFCALNLNLGCFACIKKYETIFLVILSWKIVSSVPSDLLDVTYLLISFFIDDNDDDEVGEDDDNDYFLRSLCGNTLGHRENQFSHWVNTVHLLIQKLWKRVSSTAVC